MPRIVIFAVGVAAGLGCLLLVDLSPAWRLVYLGATVSLALLLAIEIMDFIYRKHHR